MQRFSLMSVAGNMFVEVGAFLFGIVIVMWIFRFFVFLVFFGVVAGSGGVGVVKMACSEGLSVGDVSADFTEDASLSGGIDYGLGGGGARWWARYRFPRV